VLQQRVWSLVEASSCVCSNVQCSLCINQITANSNAKPTSKRLNMKTERLKPLGPWRHLKTKPNVCPMLHVVYWPQGSTFLCCTKFNFPFSVFFLPPPPQWSLTALNSISLMQWFMSYLNKIDYEFSLSTTLHVHIFGLSQRQYY
jgi:hypothetical protein